MALCLLANTSGQSKKNNSSNCPEDGGRNLLRNVGDYLLTQRHIHEDFTLHQHSCRNLRSQKEGLIFD